MPAPPRLLVISPCRDEVRFAARTLASVEAQSLLPSLWIVVDDGSTDGTGAILDAAAARLPWMRVVRLADRGRRRVGPGVVEAFYAGLAGLDWGTYEYLAKLDLDLDLPPDYFRLLIERMQAEPRLGSCSGKPWARREDGGLAPEPCGDEMSVGMTKFWRTTCFRQIGGLVREVMWDGIDCHRARMNGWIVRSWNEPELRFEHLRPMGSSQRGVLTGRVRHGAGQYFMGTGLLYMVTSMVFRLATPPVLLGSLAMGWGWLGALARGERRYPDPEFRRFLGRYQRDCLLLGKRAATQRTESEREREFDPNRAPLESLGAPAT